MSPCTTKYRIVSSAPKDTNGNPARLIQIHGSSAYCRINLFTFIKSLRFGTVSPETGPNPPSHRHLELTQHRPRADSSTNNPACLLKFSTNAAHQARWF